MRMWPRNGVLGIQLESTVHKLLRLRLSGILDSERRLVRWTCIRAYESRTFTGRIRRTACISKVFLKYSHTQFFTHYQELMLPALAARLNSCRGNAMAHKTRRVLSSPSENTWETPDQLVSVNQDVESLSRIVALSQQ